MNFGPVIRCERDVPVIATLGRELVVTGCHLANRHSSRCGAQAPDWFTYLGLKGGPNAVSSSSTKDAIDALFLL